MPSSYTPPALPPEAPAPLPTYSFPWEGLEGSLGEDNPLLLVGYGSLLSEASAALTIRTGKIQRTACIAYGCRRIYNYEMPATVRERRKVPENSVYRAALNVEITEDPSDFINGILTTVCAADLPALRQRELGYDLKPVACLPWAASPEEKPFYAYVLSAPEVALKPEWQVVNPGILPEPSYAQLCATGAAAHSPEFLQAYLQSTYLADKKTLITL